MAFLPAALFALLFAAWPVPALGGPARLHVEVDDSSVRAGGSTRVVLVLLDSRFQRVSNDRSRRVQLELRSTKGAREGIGDISPAQISLPSGTDNYAGIRFRAKAAGTVIIRAMSDGLASAEVLVHVGGGSKSLLNLLVPTVHAQASQPFEILPQNEPIPLNGLSTAQFQIFAAASTGQAKLYRIDTEPAVRIRYDDQESVGVAIVKIEEQEHLSKKFEILSPSRPRSIVIRAHALPDGPRGESTVEFVAPYPARVGIEPKQYTINSHERIVPLTVQLLDADSIPLKALLEPRQVTLETDSGAGSFDPATVTLSPTKLQAVSDFHPPVLRFGRPLTILARLDDIATAEAHFNVKAATTALVILAIFGGLLGGVARHVYRVGTPHMWPRRWKGRLEPGLVGNALGSALSGLVLFQVTDLGVLHSLEMLESAHGNGTVGFVLGVVGGFAGVAVFEVLAERVLNRKVEEPASS